MKASEPLEATTPPDYQTIAEQLNEEALQQIIPRIADAIRAIQAERSGAEPIAWSDFSSHSKK